MKPQNRALFAVAALLPFAAAASLFAQSPTQPLAPPSAQGQTSPSTKEKPKAKKVWTEDDISSVRKPWDDYQDQKAAAQQKASAAPATNTNSSAQATQGAPGGVTADYLDASGNQLPMPKSVTEAQDLIQKKQDEIARKKEAVEQATRNFENATAQMEQSAMKSNLRLAQNSLQASQDDLKELQARIATLKPVAAQGTASDTAAASQPAP